MMTLTEVAMRRCSSTNTVCFVPAYLLYRPTAHACPATAQKGTRMSSTAAWGRAHGALFAFPSCCAFRFVCTPSRVDSGGGGGCAGPGGKVDAPELSSRPVCEIHVQEVSRLGAQAVTSKSKLPEKKMRECAARARAPIRGKV